MRVSSNSCSEPEKEGIGFPTLHDRKHAVHRMFRVGSIPTVVLVDRDGIVAKAFRGSQSEDEFAAALKLVGVPAR
jgi:thioredoxin-like negative regulator of GroEL